MGSVISLRDVAKSYLGRQAAVGISVLQHFNLEIRAGEFIALTGASGVGKTTVLNLIGGLDRPDNGEIIVGNTALHRMTSRQLARWRSSQIGFVFQSHNLLGMLSAAENVELPLFLKRLSSTVLQRRVADALMQVGLSDRAHHRPAQLSGGQQQRVGIARALVTDAPILLCDEPTGNLDRNTANGIVGLLADVARSGKTVVMVTHDEPAAEYATRRVQLTAGAS